MITHEYECESGHWSGSPTPLTKCPALVLGEPCGAAITDLNMRAPSLAKRASRLYFCQPCLDHFKAEWPGLGAAEVRRQGISAQKRTCDGCHGERAAFHVPNLERSERRAS